MICNGPSAAASAWISGARNAVIQSSPAGCSSSVMRAWVIIPRSPTQHHPVQAKALSRSLPIWTLSVLASAVLPASKHLDRDRAARSGAQHAEDDLQFVGLAVAAIAELPERTEQPSR